VVHCQKSFLCRRSNSSGTLKSEWGRRIGRARASAKLENLHQDVNCKPIAHRIAASLDLGHIMARAEFSRSLRAAVDCLENAARTRPARPMRCSHRSFFRPASRYMSTTPSRPAELAQDTPEKFTAAPEIDFSKEGKKDGGKGGRLLRTLRVVPASPSYFSAKPTFTDDFISLSALLRSVATLPTIPTSEAPKVAWKNIDQYRIMTNEPVKTQRFHKMLHILRRLNCIHPSLMPPEVLQAMRRYKKDSQPGDIVPAPGVVDEWGRARGVGRRKTSSAVAWLVEGEGEVLINGKSLSQFFGRLHHRESAVWALKSTSRLDKYNLFGLVSGGGSTGQAEAMTLAVAKALLVHEPALKPALRRGESDIEIYLFSIFPCVSHLPNTFYKYFLGYQFSSETFPSPTSSANFPPQLAVSPGIQGRSRGRRPVA
jgi:small subunit ribosomal protein S9